MHSRHHYAEGHTGESWGRQNRRRTCTRGPTFNQRRFVLFHQPSPSSCHPSPRAKFNFHLFRHFPPTPKIFHLASSLRFSTFPPSPHLMPFCTRHFVCCVAAAASMAGLEPVNQQPFRSGLVHYHQAGKQARCVATVTPAFVCRGMKRVMQNGVKIFAFHKYPAGENPLFPHILKYIHRLMAGGRVLNTNTLPKSARICAL